MITVRISTSTGTKIVEVLPDSGADISAAGVEFLKHIGQHKDNLRLSTINPRTVNGMTMAPWGKIPVTIQLLDQHNEDDIHIYSGISEAPISWKAAKGLGILLLYYPYPQPSSTSTTAIQPTVKATKDSYQQPAMDKIMQEFPAVFDEQIRMMKGEKFHILLVEGAVPFCVKTPRSVPFAYREQLKVELELLQEQSIIMPVTEFTEWCAPIMVIPKKGTDRIKMCVDLSRLNCYVRREDTNHLCLWRQSQT